jgi:hypothetical protein
MASLSPIEMIQRNAELVIQSTYQQFNVSLAYDEEAVDWLDENIDFLRGKNYPPNDVAMFINMLGAFYGECIRRQFSGEWTEYQGAYMVRLENGQLVAPFSKVLKQFEAGDSIAVFFASIPRLLRQFPSQKDQP